MEQVGKDRCAESSSKSLLRAAAVAVLIFTAQAAFAQAPANLPGNPRYVFRAIGEGSPLATRTVTCLLQDEQGFIWVGTLDGLFRYDGYELTSFGADEGLPDGFVTQIVAAPDGTIWISADSEVAYFDGQELVEFKPEAERSLEKGRTIGVNQRLDIDDENNLYLASPLGILRVDPRNGGDTTIWSEDKGIPPGRVEAVHLDHLGHLWFSADRRIGRLKPGTGEVDLFESSLGPLEDRPIILTNTEGIVWVRTHNHLLEKGPGEDIFREVSTNLPEAPRDSMPALDLEGNLLLPTQSGLYFREDGRWTSIDSSKGLPTSSVSSVMVGEDGTTWIGTSGSGLWEWLGRGVWSAWTMAEGLPSNSVWGSLRDSRGRFWLGTNNGVAIWLPEEGIWKNIRNEDGLAGHAVWRFETADDGWIWSISRRTGLTRFNPDTLEASVVPLPEEFMGGPMTMAAGPDGKLWVGGKSYLLTIRREGEELVFEAVDYPADMEGCTEILDVGPTGVVWMGGSRGLVRYDGDTWRRFTTADGLRHDWIENVVSVSKAEAWVGYRRGIGISQLLVDGDEIEVKHFDKSNGLSADAIWMLERDSLGRIWTGGADGVSVIDRNYAIKHYTQSDGLLWNDVGQRAFFAEASGAVFIGTGRGLAHFDPSGERSERGPPNIVLTSVTIGGEQMLGAGRPRLDYKRSTFTVKYSGITFKNPSQVMFKYRLLGFEDEWVDTKLREARYAALPPGSYRFEVTCRSADGVWSERPAAFSFVIASPWWDSWFARVGGVILLAALLLGLLELRTRKLARDRKRLESAVAERSAQLASANAELRQMSFTDALTKVRNRRFFSTVVDAEVSKVIRNNDPRSSSPPDKNKDLVFFMIDIDFFKKVNDELGHMIGDRVLYETARRLELSIRQSDLLIRWGGEEFLVVCRDAERAESGAVAQRILDLIGTRPFEMEDGRCFRRTCSVGWACMPAYPENPASWTYERVLELADRALYLAKERGRNRGVGVSLNPEKVSSDAQEWFDRSLEELEGDYLRLSEVYGPSPTPTPIPAIEEKQ